VNTLVVNRSCPESLGLAFISELQSICEKLNVTLIDTLELGEECEQISSVLLIALGDFSKTTDALQGNLLNDYCHIVLSGVPVCVTVEKEEYCQISSFMNNEHVTWTVLNDLAYCKSSRYVDRSEIHWIGFARSVQNTHSMGTSGYNNIISDDKATTRIAKILSRLSKGLDISASGRLGYPTKAMIEISRDCNLQCALCPLGSGRIDKQPPMPSSLYHRIIDAIAPTIWKAKLYNYGEPLLHPEISHFIQYGKDAGIESIEIASNGMLLSPSIRESLLTSGLDILKVSIDGFDQCSYSKYRKGGNLKRILSNVKALRREREDAGYRYPLIEIQCLATRDTETHIQELRTMALEAGADRFRLKTFNALMAGPEMVSLGRRFLPKNRRLSRYKSYDHLAYHDRYKLPTCRWLFDRIVVSANGVVVPCCYDFKGEHSLADFQSEPSEWWWTPQREDFVAKLQQEPSYFDICKNCPTGVPDLAVKD